MKRDADKIRGEQLFREMRLDRADADDEARSVPASLSSEQLVERWFGSEMLLHTPEAINLERADGNGLSMLWNHDPMQPIGVIRDLAVVDKRLRGTLHFARNAKAEEVWGDVRDGFLERMSIGYRINEWTEDDKSDLVTATRWTLFEASIVSVPADHTVGVNRSVEVRTMGDDTVANSVTPEPQAPAQVVQLRQATAQGIAEGVRVERERVAAIESIFILPRYQDDESLALRDQAIADGWDAARTRDELLTLIGTGVAPIAAARAQSAVATAPRAVGNRREPLITAGEDALDGFHRGAMASIRTRAGLAKGDEKADAAKTAFCGMSLSELAREYLRLRGIDVSGWDKMRIVGAALSHRGGGMIGHTSADFSNLLINSANKSLLQGYEEAPETWQQWASVGSVPDFKRFDRINLSTFGDLDVVPEGGEYKYGTVSDLREYGTIKTYGKLFSISRQAIVNDDLNALVGIPRTMGRAASRMVGDEVYGILTGNPTLNQDSLALFHSTHANLITSGAAPSVTTLSAAYTWMATRTDPNSNTLNIRPAYLVVPVALWPTSSVLVAATYDPAGTAGTLTPNPWAGKVAVVADPRLDAFNAAGWFVLADGRSFPTVEAVFLEGRQQPTLEEQQAFTVDGATYKVRLDVVALALDYRGAYYNDGA